jgi:hypothetical protein
MNDLITAVVIGAIAQMIFFNISKNATMDTNINFNSLLYVGMSVVAITTAYNLAIKNKHLSKLLLEALVVGVMTLVVGKVSALLVAEVFRMSGISTPYGTEIVLITTGVLIHLLSEFSGINRWYVTNGVAAM